MEKSLDGGRSFCEEVMRDIKGPVKILECIFALPEDDWSNALNKDKSLFSKNLPGIEINFSLAKFENFLQQVKLANIIVFRGGSVQKLMNSLEQYKHELKNELANKTVVCVSAGACVVSTKYLEASDEGLVFMKDGLGYLSAGVVVHYRSSFYKEKFPKVFSWDGVDDLMGRCSNSLELLKIKEADFVVRLIDL